MLLRKGGKEKKGGKTREKEGEKVEEKGGKGTME